MAGYSPLELAPEEVQLCCHLPYLHQMCTLNGNQDRSLLAPGANGLQHFPLCHAGHHILVRDDGRCRVGGDAAVVLATADLDVAVITIVLGPAVAHQPVVQAWGGAWQMCVSV